MSGYRASLRALPRDATNAFELSVGPLVSLLLVRAFVESPFLVVVVGYASTALRLAVGVGLPVEATVAGLAPAVGAVAYLVVPALTARSLVRSNRRYAGRHLSTTAAAAYVAVPVAAALAAVGAVAVGGPSAPVLVLGLFAGVSLLARTHRLARHNGFATPSVVAAVGAGYFALALFVVVAVSAGAVGLAGYALPVGVAGVESVPLAVLLPTSLPAVLEPVAPASPVAALTGFLAPGVVALPVGLGVGVLREEWDRTEATRAAGPADAEGHGDARSDATGTDGPAGAGAEPTRRGAADLPSDRGDRGRGRGRGDRRSAGRDRPRRKTDRGAEASPAPDHADRRSPGPDDGDGRPEATDAASDPGAGPDSTRADGTATGGGAARRGADAGSHDADDPTTDADDLGPATGDSGDDLGPATGDSGDDLWTGDDRSTADGDPATDADDRGSGPPSSGDADVGPGVGASGDADAGDGSGSSDAGGPGDAGDDPGGTAGADAGTPGHDAGPGGDGPAGGEDAPEVDAGDGGTGAGSDPDARVGAPTADGDADDGADPPDVDAGDGEDDDGDDGDDGDRGAGDPSADDR